MKPIPCHYRRPFVDRNGFLFPCCFLNRRPDMAIGHISDEDIVSKLENHSIDCECDNAVFRPKNDEDEMNVLYIQASLRCHGKCAVCYVSAPHKRESVEVDYGHALRLAKAIQPRGICLEGGEIPIIPKAVEFAKVLKEELPNSLLRLITNGSYPPKVAIKMADIFDEITLSFMGFSESVYYAETSLDFAKTKNFARIAYEKGVLMRFRFICTPLTLPDAGKFIEWASTFDKAIPFVDDCCTTQYINVSHHPNYWVDTISRSREMFIKSLLRARPRFEKNGTKVHLLPKAQKILGFNAKNSEALKLSHVMAL